MKRAVLVLTAIFVTSLFGIYYGWYTEFWWFDITLHPLGGFFMAMLMAKYLGDHLLPARKLHNTLIIVGATIFIGVIWEFAEYLGNQTLIEPTYKYLGIRAYFMGDLNDTIIDLLMDILGALTFSAIYLLNVKKIRRWLKNSFRSEISDF